MTTVVVSVTVNETIAEASATSGEMTVVAVITKSVTSRGNKVAAAAGSEVLVAPGGAVTVGIVGIARVAVAVVVRTKTRTRRKVPSL